MYYAIYVESREFPGSYDIYNTYPVQQSPGLMGLLEPSWESLASRVLRSFEDDGVKAYIETRFSD